MGVIHIAYPWVNETHVFNITIWGFFWGGGVNLKICSGKFLLETFKGTYLKGTNNFPGCKDTRKKIAAPAVDVWKVGFVSIWTNCLHGACVRSQLRTHCDRVQHIHIFYSIFQILGCLKQVKLPILPYFCILETEHLNYRRIRI